MNGKGGIVALVVVAAAVDLKARFIETLTNNAG